jgi:hypothetical protein
MGEGETIKFRKKISLLPERERRSTLRFEE